MSRRNVLLIAIVVVVLVLVVWLSPRLTRANRLADQASTSEQARLWREVADRRLPPELQRLPPANPAIERRRPAPQPSSQVRPPVSGGLAMGLVNGARVVASSVRGSWEFTGRGRISAVNGERVELDLGGNRRLTFVARINKAPLNVIVGEPVDVMFKRRTDPLDRQEILAVRTISGAEIISALESGRKPVTLTITLPALVVLVSQLDPSVAGAADVSVRINTGMVTLKPGATDVVSGMSVNILGSIAEPASGTTRDGSPYAIDLLAWRPGK